MALRKFREERREAVREFVGKHWSEDGTTNKVPVNLLSLYTSTISRSLISKNPRVLLSTFNRPHKPTVKAMQGWVNPEIERMQLANTLQRVVVDALFSLGVCKVALATPADAAVYSWKLEAGQPFCMRVDLDDFVFDVHARDFAEAGYIGHRYRVPLDAVKKGKLYRGTKKLMPSTDPTFNAEGDERLAVLGRGTWAGEEEYEDFVDLWEIYLPRHRLVLTLADEGLGGGDEEPLRQQKWLGPDWGPYHFLGFETVPGNAMPKAPIMDLVDLHDAANTAYRKVIRGAERSKALTAVQGGAMEDGSRVMQADDGDIIRLDNPERVKPFVSGPELIQPILAVATVMKDLFSFVGGNLELLGGRGPQSKTAKQDELLNQNASAQILDMQERVEGTTAKVVESLCWYWHHDPFKVQRSKHSVPGLPEVEIERQVTPQMRGQVSFEDLQIKVDPYSLRRQTPQARLAALNAVVQQTVLPLAQLMMQQGIVFDLNAYLQKTAEYLDMPDLQEIITIQEPAAVEEGHGGRKMPLQTERTYTRENVPMRTEQGNDQQMVASMLGTDLGGAPDRNGSLE